MATNFGPLKPFTDAVESGYNTLQHLLGGGEPAPQAHPDTSWHDQKVAEANESHMVHEMARPQGHGLVDQKYGKGNRSPITSSVPVVK